LIGHAEHADLIGEGLYHLCLLSIDKQELKSHFQYNFNRLIEHAHYADQIGEALNRLYRANSALLTQENFNRLCEAPATVSETVKTIIEGNMGRAPRLGY